MIPKKIHYCWFGGKPLNKLGEKCLKSWKKHFPDYEIIEWNESNFDFNCCQYIKEAYEAKKWAFVSDYARYKILYEQGGIYFDTDVEVIKPFDDILEQGSFMGCENTPYESDIAVNPGLGCAAEPGLGFFREVLDDYEKSSFLKADGSPDLYTIVERTTKHLKEHGLATADGVQKIEGINIFPAEYFSPIDMRNGKMTITENTRSIHRYAASWESKYSVIRGKIYRFIKRTFGESVAEQFKKVLGRNKYSK